MKVGHVVWCSFCSFFIYRMCSLTETSKKMHAQLLHKKPSLVRSLCAYRPGWMLTTHHIFWTGSGLSPLPTHSSIGNAKGYPFARNQNMSWLRGKKTSFSNLKTEEAHNSNRSTTPTPGNPDGKREKRLFRSGLLTIRVMWAQGISLPQGVSIPPAVQTALTSQQAKVAAAVSPSSVTQQRKANRSRGNRCVFSFLL